MREFTSAIPGMAVADMRRCLSEVRHLMLSQTQKKPLDLQAVLSNNMLAWEFVHLVANGLHKKRTRNRNKKKDRVEGPEDSDFDEQ